MQQKVFICAHRGASGTFPENTVPAFLRAIELDCEMVEFDVAMTADEACVISHDLTVDRCTDGAGRIPEMTLEEVKQLDAGARFGETFAGTRIPTLEELLDALPPSLELNIHVKESGKEDARKIVDKIAAEVRRRGRYETAFIAGSDLVIDLAREVDARVRRCLLGSQDNAEIYVQRCSETGCSSMQPGNRIVTRELCDAAHRAGMRVHPFYADDPDEMNRLIDCGVDGILTNYPEKMISVLEERGLR